MARCAREQGLPGEFGGIGSGRGSLRIEMVSLFLIFHSTSCLCVSIGIASAPAAKTFVVLSQSLSE